jgi:hypothetical protein
MGWLAESSQSGKRSIEDKELSHGNFTSFEHQEQTLLWQNFHACCFLVCPLVREILCKALEQFLFSCQGQNACLTACAVNEVDPIDGVVGANNQPEVMKVIWRSTQPLPEQNATMEAPTPVSTSGSFWGFCAHLGHELHET